MPRYGIGGMEKSGAVLMKWFLVIMMLNGGTSYIPMDTQASCEKARVAIEQTLNKYGIVQGFAKCITQD